MHVKRVVRFVPGIVFGIALALAPFSLSLGGLDDQPAFAKNGGGGGKGGGNGGGRGGNAGGKGGASGNGGAGNSGGHANAGGNTGPESGAAAAQAASGARPGKALGRIGKEQSESALASRSVGDLHPSDLGRLNGFMNASPNGLANAAPNSAIGVVANAYREALSSYAGDTGETTDEAALAAAAEAMALAANKEVTPEVVAAVNARLAETYPDDPALAGFADPTSAESVAAAESIASLAESYQAEETDQGLGNGLADSVDDGDDQAGDGEDDLADSGTDAGGTATIQ